MTETTNYKFKKPSSDDFYNIDDHNQNMDAIDGELKRIEDEAKENREEHLKAANPHKITAATIGLGKVNNTSDMEKPVSTAQATAIANAKNEANATAMNYVTNSRSGHMAENIHVSADERTKWNSASNGVIQLNGKVAQQEFELIKTQEFAFIDVPVEEDKTRTFTEITGLDIANYKELVFVFTGTMQLTDNTQYVNSTTMKSRSSGLELWIYNDKNYSVEDEFASILNNNGNYFGTTTMSFDSRLRVKTDICKNSYTQNGGYTYHGLTLQKIHNALEGTDLVGKDFTFRIGCYATTSGTQEYAKSNVYGTVKIYGKKGF